MAMNLAMKLKIAVLAISIKSIIASGKATVTLLADSQFGTATIVVALLGLIICATLALLGYYCCLTSKKSRRVEDVSNRQQDEEAPLANRSASLVQSEEDMKLNSHIATTHTTNTTNVARTEYAPSTAKVERDQLKRLPKGGSMGNMGGKKSDHLLEQAVKIEIMKYKKLMEAEEKKQGGARKRVSKEQVNVAPNQPAVTHASVLRRSGAIKQPSRKSVP